MYQEGKGVERDVYEAENWLKRANTSPTSNQSESAYAYTTNTNQSASHNEQGQVKQITQHNGTSSKKEKSVQSSSTDTDRITIFAKDLPTILPSLPVQPDSLLVSIACRVSGLKFKTLGFTASFQGGIDDFEVKKPNMFGMVETHESLKKYSIISEDKNSENWFDDSVSLVGMYNDIDELAWFNQFDEAKWQGDKGTAIETIKALDNFFYDLEQTNLPLQITGMGVLLVLKWICITMIENNIIPKSKQFKDFLN
jgi:hypothetical protein